MSKLFFAFGIVVVICGVYLVTQKDYISGIAGACVGILIIYQNKYAIRKDQNCD